jgi:hypothetical protein
MKKEVQDLPEKHGIPVYQTNPSVPSPETISKTRKAKVGQDKKGILFDDESGEILGRGAALIYEWEEVDKERFIKLFLQGLKQIEGLSKQGMAVFDLVYHYILDNPGSDKVPLALSLSGMGKTTFYNGLRELLEKEFLFKSPWPGIYFVNIRYMFNGDRLAFVKAYHLQGSTPKASAAKKKRLAAGSAVGNS